jgi:hypothetical protein
MKIQNSLALRPGGVVRVLEFGVAKH